MIVEIKKQIKNLLKEAGYETGHDLMIPPNVEMGDLALPCFGLAKEQSVSPVEVAKEIAEKITPIQIVEKVEAMGPYVNFYLNAEFLAKKILSGGIGLDLSVHKSGQRSKIMVEFAHPNTHKAFHIGHLRNIITGEAIVRILENAGYEVVRANYQGDVGMHIAKCLWAIVGSGKWEEERVRLKTLEERVKYLGDKYAKGSQAFEKDEKVKAEVIEFNDKIYSRDESIKEIYETTRQWSLDYFDNIYRRVNTKFDRLYFESEVYERGVEIIHEFLKKKVFKKSEGAIIFEGSKHQGLHDRVFINSKGFPTYEAKDMALAEKQFVEYSPERIIHVVGKEQKEYFKVIFKALEEILPEHRGKEYHLDYGWVSLKHGKMSSRTGKVVLGEWLLDEVKKKIDTVMGEGERGKGKEEILEKITIAAVKYAMLKIGVRQDMSFDINESVSLSGDSGPYLLYIVARIKSILNKIQNTKDTKIQKNKNNKLQITNIEKQLLVKLAGFNEVTLQSAEELDPSKIAKYLFDLAQLFNTFYHECPVLKAEDESAKAFRLKLIKKILEVMERGLDLLGIETVDEM